MTDVRLVATNPVDSTLVPVASNSRGELLTTAPKIEFIPNDVEIDGNLIVNGDLLDGSGNPLCSGEGPPPDPSALAKIIQQTGAAGPSIPFSADGTPVNGVADLDEWLRSQPCWSTPDTTDKNGIGQDITVRNGGAQSTFEIGKASGMVMTIHITSQTSVLADNANHTAVHEISTTASEVQLIQASYSMQFYPSVASPRVYSHPFSLLITRDDFELPLTHKLTTTNSGTLHPMWSCVKKFELESAESFLIREYMRINQRLTDTKQALLELKSETDRPVTTD